MTAICGVVQNGNVYMGADSAGVAGLSITIRNDPKIFHNSEFLIAATTSFRMLQLLHHKFSPPKQTVHQTDYQYMVCDFVDAVRTTFKNNGFGSAMNSEGGKFLIGYRGTLYTCDIDFQIGIPSLQYAAEGCGNDLCLGSLHTTSKMKNTKPEERIKMALEAASNHSAGVAPPFTILSQIAAKPTKLKKIK